MYHVPMCVICDAREVQIVVNSTGAGYCSPECEVSYNEGQEEFADWVDAQNTDEPFGPMSEGYAEYDEERKLEGDMDGEPAGSYDLSDDAEALASAGFGTDEDYGYYGDDF